MAGSKRSPLQKKESNCLKAMKKKSLGRKYKLISKGELRGTP